MVEVTGLRRLSRHASLFGLDKRPMVVWQAYNHPATCAGPNPVTATCEIYVFERFE
jgi:hypothetical protein